MIRILHVLSSTYFGSGVAAFVMNYYRHIDRENIQFDFLCFKHSENNFDDEIKKLGGNVYYVNKPSIKNACKTYKEFDKFFKQYAHKYTAVHLHTIILVHFIKYFVSKYKINTLITHAHTTKHSENPKKAIRNSLMCLGLNYVVTVRFACSKEAGEFYYGKDEVRHGKVKIINNALELEKYKFNKSIRNKVRETLGLEDKFVVGHIGRMAPSKNQMFLLEIFKEVKKENSNAVLLMIGDGALRDAVEKKIKELCLNESVILLGSRRDVPELLMAMDVFVLPSLHEGLGIVVVESQAAGLPVVISDRIPKEAIITNCKCIPLNAERKIWINSILESKFDCVQRIKTNEFVKGSGFNILKEAILLESVYKELVQK